MRRMTSEARVFSSPQLGLSFACTVISLAFHDRFPPPRLYLLVRLREHATVLARLFAVVQRAVG